MYLYNDIYYLKMGNMKKNILLGLITTLVIASTVGAAPVSTPEMLTDIEEYNQNFNGFTHTVFAEECTATWCPNCPMAAEALYTIYQSGDYPFYYVSLVNDMTSVAKERNREYSFGIFKIYAFPTVYFDGGDTNMVGRGSTVQETENEYRTLIEQEGQRTPKQPITLNSSVTWEGNAKLTVTVSITNEGTSFYFGKLRSYVAEIESRWLDHSENPYHFALLDFAINKYVLVLPGKTKTLSGSFDGEEIHGNLTYPDITQDNIIVISTISHWIPHYRVGYQSTEYTQRYFARYVDQTTAALPT